MLDQVIALRKKMHSIPEPSMKEYETKRLLMDFIAENTSLALVDRGQWFFAHYVWSANSAHLENTAHPANPAHIANTAHPVNPAHPANTAHPGFGDRRKCIAFRADFDAVVGKDGCAAHFCGHDGHSAILAGLALELERMQPEADVYLIFQPGEETGQGARLCRELLKEKKIDEIYGFHNIPGYEENVVLLRNATFACASTGMEISLKGQISHAAYPEKGRNPALVMAEIILFMENFVQKEHEGVVLGTVIGAEIGSASYGVSAGEAVLRLTLRAEKPEEYQQLVDGISQFANSKARQQGLECQIRLLEEFPATVNHQECVDKVRAAAERVVAEQVVAATERVVAADGRTGAASDEAWLMSGKVGKADSEAGTADALRRIPIIYPEEPFRWSEDFGYYLQEAKGAFFGIGCGVDHAGLHTEGYEFNDEIIETVIRIYRELINGD